MVLRGISPPIWCCLLVRSDSTVAELHDALDIAMGWTGTHLHRFVTHAKEYGVVRLGRLAFADDPDHAHVTAGAVERGRFATWLLSMTHNLAIDQSRRQRTRPPPIISTDALQGEGFPDPGTDIEAEAWVHE